MEVQLKEYLNTNNWASAILTLNERLRSPDVKNSLTNYLDCLVTRLECYFELGQFEHVISECRNILNGFYDPKEEKTFDKVLRCYINSLFQLKRYQETEALLRQWISVKNGDNPEAFKLLNTLHTTIRNIGLKSPVDIHSEMASKLQVDPIALHMAPTHPPPPPTTNTTTTSDTSTTTSTPSSGTTTTTSTGSTICTYCRLTFPDRLVLRAHCQSLDHQRVIMSDEGRDWAWRAPPRGLGADAYRLCAAGAAAAAQGGGGCRYGQQCVEAHAPAELQEWRERFEYRRMKLQRAYEKELYGKSYTEEILEKWVDASAPDKVLRESLPYVQLSTDGKPSISITSKNSAHTWTFRLVVEQAPDEPHRTLRGVALLQDTFRSHFQLVKVGFESNTSKELEDANKKTEDAQEEEGEVVEYGIKNDQEWLTIAPSIVQHEDESKQGCYVVSVMFKTDIFGTFRQSVVFDFGDVPYLVQHMCADVIPVTDHHRISELRDELVISCEERWNARNSAIVKFALAGQTTSGGAVGKGAKDKEDRWAQTLAAKYPCPQADTLTLSQATVTEKRLTRNNYNCRMHELLYIEEIARYEQVAKFNLTTHLLLTTSYLLAPNGMASTTAKYAASGELFAALKLGGTLSEDTSAGRLVLNNCQAVLVRPMKKGGAAGRKEEESGGQKVVYEALIEDKGKTDIYLRLPAPLVKAHSLKPDSSLHCQIQFQLNRVAYCEWHHSVDSVTDYRLIFPETYLDPAIPWSPQRQWADITDPRLNVKQKEAVVAITTPMHIRLPPVLIIGPFGTGKTFTLAQAIKQLMRQPDARVLVCTHSNSAADLYIKDYLHPYVEEGHEEARPLRIYYHKRWVSTVNEVVQRYCLVNTTTTSSAASSQQPSNSSFHVPTVADVMRHRIVVVTLSISMYLATLDLPRGFFTHIILDEAAQAMECEAIMPLALANETTRIVLAGDHMQLSPELFSGFTKERNLHVSLLERFLSMVNPANPLNLQTELHMIPYQYNPRRLIGQYQYDLPRGFFTFIILDEAAQAMECEAIMPLALANETTRIVLAGDHMQLSPELFSEFTKERNLHVSLLERLYDHYPPTFPCKILLSENYRAHEAIIDFTSESFYDQKLIASGRQPRHDLYYPLTFFTTRGEDVQDTNSTAFYNNSEVYEIVDRVLELRNKWPGAWGKFEEGSIGIMTPYSDQVFRIRSELRKRRLFGVSVERVLNVQGKQFRAVFLSTVRTRRTCTNTNNNNNNSGAGALTTSSSSAATTAVSAVGKDGNSSGSEEADFGFLSNSKLLNTAITRAQSLVAVVGDPVALCSVGRCSKVWERFIQVCNENKSLFGITWSSLKNQLDGVELKKTYVLNPLAPEFIPRRLQQQQQQLQLQQQQLTQAAIMKAEHNYLHPLAHHIPNLQTALVKQTFFNGYDKKPYAPFDGASVSAAAAAAAAAAAGTALVLGPADVLARVQLGGGGGGGTERQQAQQVQVQVPPGSIQTGPAYDLLPTLPAVAGRSMAGGLGGGAYAAYMDRAQTNVMPQPQINHTATAYGMNGPLPNGYNLLSRVHPQQSHHDSPNNPNGDINSLYHVRSSAPDPATIQYLDTASVDRKTLTIPGPPVAPAHIPGPGQQVQQQQQVHMDATSLAMRLAYELAPAVGGAGGGVQQQQSNGVQSKYLCLPQYQQQAGVSHDLASVEALTNAQAHPTLQQQTVHNLYRADATLLYTQRPPTIAAPPPLLNMLPDYGALSSTSINAGILSPKQHQEQQQQHLDLNQRFAAGGGGNVQFLQNVHFPSEGKAQQMQPQQQQQPQHQVQGIGNSHAARIELTYQDLLPRGMTIDDMLQLPLQTKRQWYSYLAHSRGGDAARTFELLLEQALRKQQQQQQQQQLLAELAANAPWLNHQQVQQQHQQQMMGMTLMNGGTPCPIQSSTTDDQLLLRQNGYITSTASHNKPTSSESQPLYKRQGMQDTITMMQQPPPPQPMMNHNHNSYNPESSGNGGWGGYGGPVPTTMAESAAQQQQQRWKQEINEDFGNLSIQNGEDSVDDMVERYNGIMSYANVVRNSSSTSGSHKVDSSKLDHCVTSNSSVDPQSLRNSRLYQYF